MTEKKLYDDAFYVEEKRYGLWDSYTPDGKGIVTSLTEEQCIRATRFILQVRQEEANGKKVEASVHEGTMDYKL
jgi:hypothetical protein